ncbi:MAG: NapC/NirT family cytochrome c [Planctomycetota bacterium]
MERVVRWLRSLRWKALVIGASSVAAISLAGTWGAAAYTSDSKFCASCHEMEDYHSQWVRGPHKDVACLACHAPPDQAADKGTTTAGLKQWLSYSVGSFRGPLPQGIVDDANCTACHPTEDLKRSRDPFHGVPFDHRTHLADFGKGLDLRCTSCHSRVESNSHVSVGAETCYTCHLRDPVAEEDAEADRKPPVPDGGCRTCHGERLRDNLVLAARHETVLREGVSCQRCHGPMRDEADSGPTASRCRTCHFSKGVAEDQDEAKELEEVRTRRIRIECVDDCRRCHFREGKFQVDSDSTHLHDVHVDRLKVECAECHGIAGHVSDGTYMDDQGACDTCHIAVGAAQRGDFKETDAGEATDTGFAPFHASIKCGFCHVAPIHGVDAQFAAEAVMRPADACRSCHADAEEGDFGNLPAKWARSHVESLAALRRYVRSAKTELESIEDEEVARGAGALLDRARRRLDRFQGQMVGFHNLQLARHVINTIATDARGAVARMGAEDRIEHLVEPTAHVPAECAKCHLSPAEDIQLGHRVYSHQRHRDIPGVNCNTCHSDDPHPTSIALSAEQCSACHHAPEKRQNCETCHDLENSMYRGLWEPGLEEIAHVMVKKVHCAQCHFPEKGPDAGKLHPILPTAETCLTCHEKNVGLLLDEWRENVKRAATRLEVAVSGVRAVFATLSDQQKRTVERAEAALADVKRDRSNGVHNPTGVQSALTRYALALERMTER